IESGKNRSLLLRRGCGDSRVLAHQIIPDNSLLMNGSLSLRLVLRPAVGGNLLIGQTQIWIVFADIDGERPILGREASEAIKLQRRPRPSKLRDRKTHRVRRHAVGVS